MRNAIVFVIACAGCRASVHGSAATDPQSPGPPAAPDAGASPMSGAEEVPTYPNGLVAMVGAEPQWFGGPWASDMSQEVASVHVAMVVNGKPVVFMDTGSDGKPKARKDFVKNGDRRAEASLLGPQERAFLMAGPGPYQVKTLCYTREADGSFRLFGGGLRERSEMRIVVIHATACRPIAAAVVAP